MLKPSRKKRPASTILQWRTSKDLVKAARLKLDDEVLQEMLAVVDNASPLNGNQLAFGSHVTATDHSRHLGRIEGFNMYRQALESLGQLQTMPKEPKATYSAEE